ncbi:unnamed protein product [Rotaria sp. Silwood1]|nr:unnamed protein product [Rotaria sp. Silwood1]CAF1269778.1 unnamed protein product [Rotaria sp. Silwood1]CAF3481875.1 unnamed protein product [Rotaria sp. Silwood1]CAF3502364.1 unnamed protein product [Rotaria sp. Silwood1]CAF3506865.1 unnamed protein product [Rotaria sp. Silwood1]
MFGETVNNIIGRTVNPYNRLLACGGSSGGEGALLALHGSSVGVGTDLAGSIRIPASSSNLWNAWILPVASCSAVKHDDFKYFGYTGVINLLDWPATTISVTFADKDKDIKNMQYKSMSDLDKETYKAYDSDIYDGEPVGIQLVGKRFQEEYLLGLAEQIGEALVA